MPLQKILERSLCAPRLRASWIPIPMGCLYPNLGTGSPRLNLFLAIAAWHHQNHKCQAIFYTFFHRFKDLEKRDLNFLKFSTKSWAPDTYFYDKKNQNEFYGGIFEIQGPKGASQNHHIGVSGRQKTLETTRRSKTRPDWEFQWASTDLPRVRAWQSTPR